MGAAELGAILGVVWTVLVPVLAFLAKRELDKIDELKKRLDEAERRNAELDKKIAVLEASKLADRVVKLEADMGEIKGDLRVIRAWVEGQEDGRNHFRRRSGDQEG